MGVIIPLPLRARPANAASRFETIGSEPHRATMLTFPQSQTRDIRNVWGMTVEGPPRMVADAVPFGDDEPAPVEVVCAKPAAQESSKSGTAKTAAAKPKSSRAPK